MKTITTLPLRSLYVIVVIASLLGVDSTAFAEDGCVCPDVYDPVCGADGQTYSNDCAAGCAEVAIAAPGECEGDRIPEDNPIPPDDTPAQPTEKCACPDVYEPVCGADGLTYSNDCEARCAGVSIVGPKACKGDSMAPDTPPTPPPTPEVCTCPAVEEPVCGDDGVTYINECDAACHEVKIVHHEPCRGDEVPEQ